MKLFFLLTLCLPLFGAAQGFKFPPRDSAKEIRSYYDNLLYRRGLYQHRMDSCVKRSDKLDTMLRVGGPIEKMGIKKIQWLMKEFNACMDCRYFYWHKLEQIEEEKEKFHNYLK